MTTGTWLTDTGVGVNLQVYFAHATVAPNNAATNGNVVAITGLVVLPGIQLPTSAELPQLLRPDDVELPQCQRLYWKAAYQRWLYIQSASGGPNLACGVTVPMPVRMRIAPNSQLYDNTGAAGKYTNFIGTNGITGTVFSSLTDNVHFGSAGDPTATSIVSMLFSATFDSRF
ncbi:hypothetical protein V1282_000894 [Nitrobacteraceae bacterium AZCC 2146]